LADARQLLVAHKRIAGAGVLQRLVHLEFAGGTGLGLLLVHGGGKAGLVHRQATLAAHVGRQVQRKTVGVVQLEGHLTGQHLHTTVQGCIQDLHADFQRLVEALFLGLEHLHDAVGVLRAGWGTQRPSA